jgi:hypothetical protein
MASDSEEVKASDIPLVPPVPAGSYGDALTPQQKAVLAIDIAWVQWRAEFRKKVVASGVLRGPWRSVFEADMIFSIIGHRWITGSTITLKELATYFQQFATESTVSRHVDDMEYAGMLIRQPDPKDRRRLLLVPTQRLEAIGREFLQERIAIMRQNGFVWQGGDDNHKTATD